MNFPKSLLFCIFVVLFILVAAEQQLEITLVTKSISLTKKTEGLVKVRITDAAGKFATKAKVFLVKAFPSGQEENVLVSNQELFAVEGDTTTYQFNFLALKPEAGSYVLEFRAVPVEKKSGFLAADNVAVSIKVIGTASLSDAQLTVSDSSDPQSIAEGRKYKSEFGKKVEEVVRVEYSQQLLFEFRVRGQTGKNIQVQQAFLRISHPSSGREVIKVAEFASKGYSVEIPIRDLTADFYGQSGNYDLQLIAGDAFLQNPVAWTFATVHIKFPNTSKVDPPSSPFDVKPEIIHQFRVPDVRPPKTISMAFTGAVLGVPFLILIVGLFSVGANFGNFPSGANFLFAIGFQATLGAILALFVIYWIRLNMVQTLGYLFLLSLPFLFFSHRNLNALSKGKEHVD